MRQPLLGFLTLFSIALMLTGFVANYSWLGLVGAILTLSFSIWAMWETAHESLIGFFTSEQLQITIAILGVVAAGSGFVWLSPLGNTIHAWYDTLNWDRLGTVSEIVGAFGQILIALLALYVAWEQYVIGRDLTIKSNTITQQQTIDSYFEGISQLMLDEQGLLEDFPMERAIAEGRTAAILSSVDGQGKARILRFLSRSGLITPLRRDRRLGRAILDGAGGYAEDRENGLRVIDLGVMLAGANLRGTDLRWTDLSDINMIRSDMSQCDLVRTNLSRTILCDALFVGADMQGVRLFYGEVKTATPRTRADIPNYKTGEFTGSVIEGADFRKANRLSEEHRYYCCAWGGEKTRKTVPGGCEGIPNRLGR